MANYSVCGINCDGCKFKTEKNCKGCNKIEGKVFWGDCDLYDCCKKEKLEHCGYCKIFPCIKLEEWSKSENPERIENLKKLL